MCDIVMILVCDYDFDCICICLYCISKYNNYIRIYTYTCIKAYLKIHTPGSPSSALDLECCFHLGSDYMITPKIKSLGCRFIKKNLEGFVKKSCSKISFSFHLFSAQPDFFCEVLAGRTNHSSILDSENDDGR